jgi:hypothetical protein
MSRWWKGVAVLAAWLGAGVAGQAQQEIPAPVGAARTIAPLRYTPEPQPNLVPGPVTPAIAPVGPPPCLDLPADHASAFQCEQYTPESAFYGAAGGFGLQRYPPGHLPIAVTAGSVAPPPVNPGFFAGAPGATTSPLTPLVDLHDLHPDMVGGVRATFGYLWCSEAVEFVGMIQPENTKTMDFSRGPFLVPFANSPAGFTGSMDPFSRANLVEVSYKTLVGSAELNYRTWNSAINRAELILGVRYLYTQEELAVLSEARNTTTMRTVEAGRPVFTTTTTQTSAIYAVATRNNIVGPQVGGEYSTPCTLPYLGWLWFTGMGKITVGPNMVDRVFTLTRNDGLVGLQVSRESVQVGQIYELSGFLDMHILERMRLRVGYQALWAVGVSEPASQFNFDLGSQGSRHAEQGSSFWHGPVAEIQFLW